MARTQPCSFSIAHASAFLRNDERKTPKRKTIPRIGMTIIWKSSITITNKNYRKKKEFTIEDCKI